MVYSTSVPATGQSLGETRTTIQGNFADINTAFGKNHVALTTSTDGKHNFMQMPEQGAAPTTAANEGALYTKEDNSITNLFWRQEGNGTEVKMTGPAPSNAASGYTFLPGNLLIQWGSTTVADGATVTFPTPFGTVYTVNLTVAITTATLGTNTAHAAFSLTNSDFKLRRPAASNLAVSWVAIGSIT